MKQMKRTALNRKKPLKAKKGLNDLISSGLVRRASSILSARKPMRKRAKTNQGWVDVAKEIWDDPENRRTCEACGIRLGDEFSPTFYHHMLHRGSYRKYKRDKRNLLQVCPSCHDDAHQYRIEILGEHSVNWHSICLRYRKLKQEAHGIQ